MYRLSHLVANILSLKFTDISMGNWLIIWNCILIVGQILILRKKFQLIQLLQVPFSFLFGYFTDFGMWCVSFILINSYTMRLVMVILGVIIFGFGISLSIMGTREGTVIAAFGTGMVVKFFSARLNVPLNKHLSKNK